MFAGDVMRHICLVTWSSSFDLHMSSNPPVARRTHLSASATSSWREREGSLFSAFSSFPACLGVHHCELRTGIAPRV